jgi:D-hydroxyproline dehydrogenase subunit gamma
MFRLRRDGEAGSPGGRPSRAVPGIAVTVEGRPVLVPEGASAAAALLLAGFGHIRETPVEGAARAPYCMMGICFDCLAEIDGVPNRQSCMVGVRPGMQIRRQIRARAVDPE